MRLVYHGVSVPRHAPLQCTPLLLACRYFCATCHLAARGSCGARSVCMLIVLQLDCGVLPPVGTTHFSRFGLTRTDTTYIAGVDRRQSSVFRCVVGRPLRLLCTSCFVQLATRHFFRLAYCRVWLAHCMPGLLFVDWTLESLRSAVAVIITPYRASLSFFAYSHWLP